MPDFSLKTNQIKVLAGVLPQTPLGKLTAPTDHLMDLGKREGKEKSRMRRKR